ncbi:MAG: sugar transporter [Flavobacterium sp. BFFFF1]|uniref:polysaccharide biosynthesis/export family protein n=1 Tax=unclassified Flavobacterium TaxID=196869 RepID=UPI000BD97FB6|nr:MULTISPECIES: polysaccharide biosynthesis/export family protein [unclassified Flavobacterium]OYU81506.1 MAG: sugar transporter [Flavobacterium sp. BFFFF1]
MIKRILLFLIFVFAFASCASNKNVHYFQGIDDSKSSSEKVNFEPQLQPDDLLLIIVSAPDPEAAAPYNLLTFSDSGVGRTDNAASSSRYQTYLIDNNGEIEFPVLGRIKMGGLTKSEAVEKLKSLLRKYITSPIINLRIINYKFSVMGEVARPGLFNVPTERVTLPEAISMAGDLTIYGDRKQILVIRDVDGVKTHNFIDITSADFINSPFYYLDQNDVVYVRPNKTRVNSSVVGPNVTVGISAVSLLITIIALIAR